MTIAPTNVTVTPTDSLAVAHGRKKASSVSFSLDSNTDETEKDEVDKQETRKSTVIMSHLI